MSFLTPLPSSLTPFNPVVLMATFFGIGRLPHAPGTWGSLVALPTGIGLALLWGPVGVVVGSLVMVSIGLWAADIYGHLSGKPDAPEIVIDEVAGQWLTMMAMPLTPLGVITAFVLFRVFDIVKPWPIRFVDKKLKGSSGVMLDDLIAAVYASCIFLVLRWVFDW
ncbi:MAG: phosphatidylglycerophosphatase A [Parvularculales bacterium]